MELRLLVRRVYNLFLPLDTSHLSNKSPAWVKSHLLVLLPNCTKIALWNLTRDFPVNIIEKSHHFDGIKTTHDGVKHALMYKVSSVS